MTADIRQGDIPLLDAPIYLVSFSGGKDSVATWLLLERQYGLPVQCLFADTGWESEMTYEYIEHLEADHGLPIVRIYPKVRHIWVNDPPAHVSPKTWEDRLNMKDLTRLKGRPPSPTARFCTTVLKMRPLREYVQRQSPEAIIASGIRAEESEKRANMASWIYDEFMGRWRWLPIHRWTITQVFDIHRQFNVPPNPLYKRGCSRVGCWPCIFARKGEIAAVARDPKGRQRLMDFERDLGKTFFALGKASKRYHSIVDPKSGKPINTAEDCFRWATGQAPIWREDSLFVGQDESLDIEEDIEAEVCSSIYGLCE